MKTRALAIAFVVCAPLTAAAQGGPMIVERVNNGFAIAPEVKVTEVDHRTSELVGGTAGVVLDNSIFFGGGGFWNASGSHDREMGYGGFVFQWLAHSNDTVSFAAKALIGGGTATLTDSITETIRVPNPIPLINGRPDLTKPPTFTTQTITTQVRRRDDFFVAEPELDVRVRLTKHARFTAGAGYRAVGADRGDSSRLRGAVGTVGIQLGSNF
ncbi:MAG TPA: hypothetical protein VFA59_19850 [Vicinamibacterales bacterium]|nr:hypothetical protein [Vicinamibacterales bacterium]